MGVVIFNSSVHILSVGPVVCSHGSRLSQFYAFGRHCVVFKAGMFEYVAQSEFLKLMLMLQST